MIRRKFSSARLYRDHEKQFFKNVVVGDTYTYYEGHYIFKDVRRLANKYGFNVVYNEPNTPLYKLYGCFNFSVIGVHDIPEPEQKDNVKEVLYFDVDELAI